MFIFIALLIFLVIMLMLAQAIRAVPNLTRRKQWICIIVLGTFLFSSSVAIYFSLSIHAAMQYYN